MQVQSQSVYKTLTWLLALIVIGLYALHLWHSDRLKDNLAMEQGKTTEAAQNLKQANARLSLATQAENDLRGEIQSLTARIEGATQANQALQNDMAALKQSDAEILAADHKKAAEALAAAQAKAAETLTAEQKKASEAYTDLQGRFDAATHQIATLGTNVERLKQVQADAAANHEAQLAAQAQQHQTRLQEAEASLNERIAALRTALEGSDPDRATLFASFEQRVQSGLAAIADLETANGKLTAQLTAAKQTVDEGAQALGEAKSQLQNTQAQLTQALGELSQLQTQHDAAMEKATFDLAGLQAKHDAAVKQAGAERADMEAQHAAALEAAAKQRNDLESTHAAALEAAVKQRADLEAAHAAAMDQASKDTAALKASHQDALAQANASFTEKMVEANTQIETLSANLAAETAALAALQTKHDNLVAELSGKLADTEQALAGVKSDLSAAQQAAAEQKAALEQQIAAATGRVATLEETLSSERKQAEAALAASKQAHTEAMERQHNLLVEVSALGGKETDRGLLLTLAEADLTFPVGKATLPSGDLPSLDHIATLMTHFPRLTGRIEGHTDASGRDETNLALSQERADAVKQALVERGIASERMEAIGIGEARPIADNATRAGSRQNRRVEVYVIEATQ